MLDKSSNKKSPGLDKNENGVLEGIRTPDRRLRRPLLYPAELPGRLLFNLPLYYISFVLLNQVFLKNNLKPTNF